MDIVWKGVYFSPMTDERPLTKHLFTCARIDISGHSFVERPDSLLEAEAFEGIPPAIGIRSALPANFSS